MRFHVYERRAEDDYFLIGGAHELDDARQIVARLQKLRPRELLVVEGSILGTALS